jgi:phage terminase small subunit
MIRLTSQQENFAELVAAGLNQSEAYRRAYRAGRMKAETIHKRACELAADGKVAGRIAELRGPALEKAKVAVERTLLEIARIAYADPRKLFREDGTLKAVHELDDETAAMVASMEREEIKVGERVVGHTRRIRLWDKNAALEKAMKHLGLYERDNRQGRPQVVIVATSVDERL